MGLMFWDPSRWHRCVLCDRIFDARIKNHDCAETTLSFGMEDFKSWYQAQTRASDFGSWDANGAPVEAV